MRSKIIAKLLPVIFIVGLLAIHLVDNALYSGVMRTWLFDLAIIVLILCFVFMKEFGIGKAAGFSAIFVVLTVVCVINLPSTTYEGGKAAVRKEINSGEVSFVPTDYKLLPTTPLKSWFIDDYYYHYEVEVSGEKLYYAVNPISGASFQLEEDFFKYDR